MTSIQVPEKEIFRYLGYRGVAPDEQVKGLVQQCVSELQARSQLRSVSRVYPLTFPGENELLVGNEQTDCMHIHSANLYKNMKGCEKAAMFAATIGQGVDLLIRRAEASGAMTAAAVYQAAGAAMVEAWCDEVNRNIIGKEKAEGLYARPRFSPGYGDFALEHQHDFFRMLDITRNTAISLSDTLLMSPSKSVTAIIGLSRQQEPCILQGCEECASRKTCAFRR